MGGALEAVRVAQAPDDVRPGTHRAGDDAQLALPGADRALARDQQLLAEVHLLGHVVVVAVHRVREADARAEALQHILVESQHGFAVGPSVALGPEQVAPVLLHLARPGQEDGEIAIGQALVVGQLLRPADMDFRQRLPDVARSRMQHQPDPVLGVEAQLEEVVAAAQRAELVAGLRLQVAHGGRQLLEVAPQLRVALHRSLVLLEPDRDGALDFAPQAA